MNKQRLKLIAESADQLLEISHALEALLDEEQDSYDNLPESLQSGRQGDRSQEAVDALGTARDALDMAIEYLEGVK